jgi:MYXO-CTERM domain-containing protein
MEIRFAYACRGPLLSRFRVHLAVLGIAAAVNLLVANEASAFGFFWNTLPPPPPPAPAPQVVATSPPPVLMSNPPPIDPPPQFTPPPVVIPNPPPLIDPPDPLPHPGPVCHSPEPATAISALVGAGILGLLAGRRQRRRVRGS